MRLFEYISLFILSCSLGSNIVNAATSRDSTNSTNPTENDRPNFLFIAVDDLRPQLGSYGDSIAITPNMDRIAEMGMVFNKAYCQQAVCAPSRASVLTGRRPDATKVWDLKTHFREALPTVVTLPQNFKMHGYEARSVGKIYHDTKSLQDSASWSSPAVLEITDEAGKKYVLSKNQPTQKTWKKDATERADVADSEYVDGKVSLAAVEAIRDLKDTSFFLAVGFRRPHLPFSAPAKYWNLYDRDKFTLPSPMNAPENAPKVALHRGVELRGYQDIPDSGKISNDKIRQLYHGYYASISYIDAQIGMLINELEKQDLLDNTVIVVWSDHGFHLGELGLWAKTSNFELDTRVPLIIATPKQKTGGSRTDAIVELVDIYPTLSELAGIPLPEGLDGESLLPVLKEPSRSGKNIAVSQFPRPWMYKDAPEIMGYSIRTAEFRYTEWRNVADGTVEASELYHYDANRIEGSNLSGMKNYQFIEAEMKKQLSKLVQGPI